MYTIYMQCIFDPKMAETAKKRIFQGTTMSFDDLKQLPPVSDQVLDKSDVRFRRKYPNTWFLNKNGQILDQKRVKNGPDICVRRKIFIDHF